MGRPTATGSGAAATGPVRRIAANAAPLYTTMIVGSVAATVDAALLGRHGTASLAAFAVAIAVFNPVISTMGGAERGVTPFVATHRDEPAMLAEMIRAGRWLGYLLGAVGAVVVACVPLIARATGVPGATLAGMGALPWLLAASVMVTAVGSTSSAALVGLGRSKAVMRSGLTGTCAAVVLSVVLVRGAGPVPSLGPTGAGLAMLGSTLISRTISQVALVRSPELRGVRTRPGRPDLARIRRLAGVGIPLAGTVLVKFAVMAVLTFAAARTGTADAAVMAVCVTLSNVLYTVAVAVGQSTVPLIAACVRAGERAGAREAVRAGTVVALGAIAVLGAVLLTGRRWAVPVFSGDPRVTARVLGLLPLVLAGALSDAAQAVAGFGLVGLRRTVPSLVSTAVWFGLLGIAAVPVASAGGLPWLWVALVAANVLQAVSKLRTYHVLTGRLAAPDAPPVPTTPAVAAD